MKQKIFLSLLILTLFALIIISGCGGGSGTTQTVSLFTPTPHNSGNMAYLTFRVKWPEQGKSGKLIVSSSGNDEKEITASMPPDAQKIEVKVFNFKDKNQDDPIVFTDTDNLLASGRLLKPDILITIPVQIPIEVAVTPNILPAIPVKIWAGSHKKYPSTIPHSEPF